MQKKLFAILLAITLVISLGSAACTAEAEAVPEKVNSIEAELMALAPDADATEGAEAPGMDEQDPPSNVEDGTFADVAKDAYYFEPVNWAVEREITQGMGDGLFMPDATCTRAQVVTFLWRLDGMPTPQPPKFMFTDVAVGSWYDEAVLWAVENQVTDGMGDGIFLPDGTCTRSQIVTFLWKYAGKPVADAQNPFADVAEDAWYADAVVWAVDQGITTGLTETSFGPEAPCTRAQIVTFLYRYADSDIEEPPVDEPIETEPAVTEPVVTEPTETEPAETEPAETKPSVTEPAPSEPNWGGGDEDMWA